MSVSPMEEGDAVVSQAGTHGLHVLAGTVRRAREGGCCPWLGEKAQCAWQAPLALVGDEVGLLPGGPPATLGSF